MTHSLVAASALAENQQMSDKLKTTVRIQRPAKVESDGSGKSVWADPVGTAEFELLSTVELRKILKSNDEAAKQSIAAAASASGEGVLARDTATGHFEILDDADLQKIMEQDMEPPTQEKLTDVIYEAAFDNENSTDELSLVSTLALKKILKDEDVDEPVAEEPDHAGFDPYDKS